MCIRWDSEPVSLNWQQQRYYELFVKQPENFFALKDLCHEMNIFFKA
jgi:hypothetical protein